MFVKIFQRLSYKKTGIFQPALKSQNIPHPILYGNSKVTQLGEQSKQYNSNIFIHSIDNPFFLMMLY